MENTFQEVQTLQVQATANVVVLGGGPSGVVAALAAARHGAKVILIEKNSILGGLATAGHVCLFEPLCDGHGRQVTSGMVEEMFFRSIAYSYNTLPPRWAKGKVKQPNEIDTKEYMGGQGRFATLFNIPAFALSMEECLRQAGVEIWYDTLFCNPVMEGAVCQGVIVENASGRSVVACNQLIDATGACLAFFRAGADCATYKNRFTFECLDTDFRKMQAAIDSGNMQKAIFWRILGWNPVVSDPSQAHEFEGLTAQDINEYLYLSHQVALDYLKEQDSTYAMLSLPTMAQIRMIRRIKGLYEMCPEDMFQTMEDSVGCVSDWRKVGPVYEVPYRSLFVKEFSNMAAVGRNLSAQDDTWDIMRCYPGAMTTGQAAGTAAAMAAKQGIGLRDLPVAELQKVLQEDGVILHIPQ